MEAYFATCDDGTTCDDSMLQETLKLAVWETSVVDNAAARSTSNFRFISQIVANNFNSVDNLYNYTKEINFETSEHGFYFAIRDEASCVALSRVIVFFNICPENVNDLVMHPETLSPPISREISKVEVITECVLGASPENGITAILKCAQGGVWKSVPYSGCQCNSGSVKGVDNNSCIGQMIQYKIHTLHCV